MISLGRNVMHDQDLAFNFVYLQFIRKTEPQTENQTRCKSERQFDDNVTLSHKCRNR